MRWFIALMAFLIAGAAPSAHGTVIITAAEAGGDVVFWGSGTLELTAWNLTAPNNPAGPLRSIDPSSGFALGAGVFGVVDIYTSPLDFGGPSSYGSGTFSTADSGSGDIFGFAFITPGLFVPAGYSGGALSTSATFVGQTFASLGVTVGSYTWTWGSGASADSLTLNVVPEPSTALLLVAGLAGLVVRRQRLH